MNLLPENSGYNGKKLIRTALASYKQVNGEILILHHPSSNYFTLNSTAAAIWNYMTGSRTVQEIIDFIHREFDVKRNAFQEGVFLYIQDLLKEGLLETVEK